MGTKGQLIKAFGQHSASADKRRILQKDVDAGDGGKFVPKILNDLVHVGTAGAWCQMHEDAPAVPADRGTTRANR